MAKNIPIVEKLFLRLFGGIAGSKVGTFFTTGFLGAVGRGIFWFIKRLLLPLMFARNIYKQIEAIFSDKILMEAEYGWWWFVKSFFRGLGAIFKALAITLNDFFLGIPEYILRGLGWLADKLPDTLTKPFKKLWDWLETYFFGKSPSRLALLILKGIDAIRQMMFNSLTWPFKMAWNFIKDLPNKLIEIFRSFDLGKILVDSLEAASGAIIEAVKNIGGKIWKWIKEMNPFKFIGDESIEGKAAAAYIPAVNVTPVGTKLATEIGGKSEVNKTTTIEEKPQTQEKLLKDILDAINKLNENLETGKIGWNVDGQLLSATIARQTEFRGGYGVNKI